MIYPYWQVVKIFVKSLKREINQKFMLRMGVFVVTVIIILKILFLDVLVAIF
jgi:hypothetical protein